MLAENVYITKYRANVQKLYNESQAEKQNQSLESGNYSLKSFIIKSISCLSNVGEAEIDQKNTKKYQVLKNISFYILHKDFNLSCRKIANLYEGAHFSNVCKKINDIEDLINDKSSLYDYVREITKEVRKSTREMFL